MAKKISIPPSYLSEIGNGTRLIPLNFSDLIMTAYPDLAESEIILLKEAANEAWNLKAKYIYVGNMKGNEKQLVKDLVSKIDGIQEEDYQEIRRILSKYGR